MRLTIIPSDNMISMDGRVLEFSFDAPSDLHAIQWYDDNTGDVATDGGRQSRNATLDDVTPYVNLFNAEAQRLENIEVPPPTYAALRAAEYPPIEDYIDGVVKGDQAQIDAYIAACQAVKAKYPKGE
jgi:hypothetical protein